MREQYGRSLDLHCDPAYWTSRDVLFSLQRYKKTQTRFSFWRCVGNFFIFNCHKFPHLSNFEIETYVYTVQSRWARSDNVQQEQELITWQLSPNYSWSRLKLYFSRTLTIDTKDNKDNRNRYKHIPLNTHESMNTLSNLSV
jgi:hypothetical protein